MCGPLKFPCHNLRCLGICLFLRKPSYLIVGTANTDAIITSAVSVASCCMVVVTVIATTIVISVADHMKMSVI